jgi:pyridoxal phosphate enzyme (YggS family)
MATGQTIAQNLERLRAEIAAACARAGRADGSVALMAVSKTHPAEAVLEAYAAGQRLFGENRVQEWQGKAEALRELDATAADELEMHLIGPLQSNKTGRAAELFAAVDTVDALKTAERLHAGAAALGRTLPVLIEVKLSEEESKHGVAPEALPGLLEQIAALTQNASNSGIIVRGLMTVPPFLDDLEQVRPYFVRLRGLRDEHAARYPQLTELSMGMSHDYAVAVEEGSTCVRVGTAIFGRREYP